MTSLKDQCFGVEVEMTGITRKQAAQALADYFGTVPKAKGGVYDTWKVKDPTGKEWKLVSDASIIGEQWTGTEYLENDIKDFRVELVTPKLTYPELPKLQECMRRLKQIGAKVNDSCGIHVHVDAANHNRQSLKNLISIMYSKEDIWGSTYQHRTGLYHRGRTGGAEGHWSGLWSLQPRRGTPRAACPSGGPGRTYRLGGAGGFQLSRESLLGDGSDFDRGPGRDPAVHGLSGCASYRPAAGSGGTAARETADRRQLP